MTKQKEFVTIARLRRLFEQPPVLTIEEIKQRPLYNRLLAGESYGMAARTIQRDADYNYMIKRLFNILPSMKSGLW